ncbi:Dynein heavy chain family protein [Reticulomyxa filosa]|uniref:Dynein heavy chain family protein n=1 Tax=Reticulomyxa filosa TaxID=46433 RepID=X6P5W0_RETFI|nr:Dynein heavy chain family protein [Reticulomyxa filosa]|eukprot:ETO33002.1 Dynein heavy chain family protein [Reticulomyxa filosa]
MKTLFTQIFDALLEPAIHFVRANCAEPVPSVNNNLVRSLMKIIDCLLLPWVQNNVSLNDVGSDNHSNDNNSSNDDSDNDKSLEQRIAAIIDNAANVFVFALIWSVGATTNEKGRNEFDRFLRANSECRRLKCFSNMPDSGTVYDCMFDLKTCTWVPWMNMQQQHVRTFEPTTAFAEMIVPTKDLVRNTYWLDLLVKKDFHVLFTGNTGTGKTVNVHKYLRSCDTKKYQPLAVVFSAATTARQLQSVLEERLDTKRRQRVYGPPLGTRCFLFVDDLNMPQPEIFGAQPPIEFLRQWLDHVGWWKRLPTYTFCEVVDMVVLGAMGPPGGGRNSISPRLLRHFNQIANTDLSFESLFSIFDTILTCKMANFHESIQAAIATIVKATIEVYFSVCDSLLPTPSKSHYTFNLRDLSNVHQGLLFCKPRQIPDMEAMIRLWVHENRRVFQDRLTNDKDRAWFDQLLSEKMTQHFSKKWEDLIVEDTVRLMFINFVDGVSSSSSEEREYQQVTDMKKLERTAQELLDEYNNDIGSSLPMNLVLFADALEHISRITRVLSLPQGNALLLGVGGSGRQSLTRLAAFVSGYHLFQIEISKNYGKNEWREDVKKVLLQSGIDEKPTVFLFTDNQIVAESFLEDLNNILNSGDIPGLWSKEEYDKITETCKMECLKKKVEPSKLNIHGQFITRVKANLHLVICMSPMGEKFRTRLRMFPALVNCCTIDWFKLKYIFFQKRVISEYIYVYIPWPADALRAVAQRKLSEQSAMLADGVERVVKMFVYVHQSVEEKSKVFAQTLGRHNYVTPTSYLELLSTFKSLLKVKKSEVKDERDKFANGVEKLDQAAHDVAQLQVKLRDMQPVLKKTQEEVEDMMVKIHTDRESAAKEEEIVSKQEREASAKAQECEDIKRDAETDLAKALPALHTATTCLQDLKKADIDEVRAFRNPPAGVRLTMEVACIVLGVSPVKKKDIGNPTKKVDDYWEAAQKKLLADPKKLLQTLVEFDKDSLNEKLIETLTPFIEDPSFTVTEIEKASKACKAICMWAHAMHTYYHVAKEVEPKRARLHDATKTLEVVQTQLSEAKSRLRAVMDRLTDLQTKYEQAVQEKERLAREVDMCSIKLERAERLIGGLGGERTRWSQNVSLLDIKLQNVTGDVSITSGAIAYLGAFTSDFRTELYDLWRNQLLSLQVFAFIYIYIYVYMYTCMYVQV